MQVDRSPAEWRQFLTGCLDFRPAEGIYRVRREMFTDQSLFDLEMEHLFEKNWVYACHESELPDPGSFITMKSGRQSIIVTRAEDGSLHALLNACAHRGATLARTCKGKQRNFVCPFHAWTYRLDGSLAQVKAPREYGDDFDVARRSLRKAAVESYRGFVFVNLDGANAPALQDWLGDARVFLDLMVAQSPTGELEVIPGRSTYAFDGNWKLQTENGLDGYHVSTVHFNYVATVLRRHQENSAAGDTAFRTLDYRKLGAGDRDTDDGWFAFAQGHSLIFSDMPNPEVRPGYDAVMPRVTDKHGPETARWIMHKLRNLNLYPSLFFMDQISSQLRIIRPVAWNRTEIISQCLGVKGESAADRENRIRQFEDFFNVSGMGTPDDLAEFREAQKGFESRLDPWNDLSRGHQAWLRSETAHARTLGIKPAMTGVEFTHEGLFVNQHRTWQETLLRGLDSRFGTR